MILYLSPEKKGEGADGEKRFEEEEKGEQNVHVFILATHSVWEEDEIGLFPIKALSGLVKTHFCWTWDSRQSDWREIKQQIHWVFIC